MTKDKIKKLNDAFRQSFTGGKVLMTRGVADLDLADRLKIIRLVQNFNQFTPDNNPYGEHDFGSIQYKGAIYFGKIDYYDIDYRNLSPAPNDPSVTNRVLTVMTADEY